MSEKDCTTRMLLTARKTNRVVCTLKNHFWAMVMLFQGVLLCMGITVSLSSIFLVLAEDSIVSSSMTVVCLYIHVYTYVVHTCLL